MFSREESASLRRLFWVSFFKSYPTKWTLYNTKIKGFSFKFYFDTKKAMVMLDIEGSLEHRLKYYDKVLCLKSILEEEIPCIVFSSDCVLDTKKAIHRIFVEKKGVCIHNKGTWSEAMEFLNFHMLKFEGFWATYKDVIKD